MSIDEALNISPEKTVYADGEALKRLAMATRRLYTERAFRGDEMRDLAQRLDAAIGRCFVEETS